MTSWAGTYTQVNRNSGMGVTHQGHTLSSAAYEIFPKLFLVFEHAASIKHNLTAYFSQLIPINATIAIVLHGKGLTLIYVTSFQSHIVEQYKSYRMVVESWESIQGNQNVPLFA